MKLSKRLKSIASLVPVGARVADIGTDHAYLPVYLVDKGIISYAVAGDLNKGPCQAAVEHVQQAGFSEYISVRMGNGLSVLNEGEADTIIVAGMGGSTIIEILAAKKFVASRLILQPMIAAAALRKWLIENGWRIIAEDLVEEDNILYEIIAAEPGTMEVSEPILFDIGPVLWEQRHPLLLKHIELIIQQTKKILQQMSNVKSHPKYKSCQQRLELLEAKRLCL